MITASTFAASAVLKKAPILPGFSGASATRTSNSSFLRFKLIKLKSLALEIAIIPSVELRYATFL